MRSIWLLSTLWSVASALSILQHGRQHTFSNPAEEERDLHFPTIHESAVMARRILQLSTEGNLVTIFPEDHSNNLAEGGEVGALENRPLGMGGSPIGLMEYYADCEGTGNPTFLAIDISTPFRNYNAGSNISFSVRWWPTQTNSYSLLRSDEYEIPTPHTPAALPRFSLQGHIELIDMKDIHNIRIPACFVEKHPDSILWQPGSKVHSSKYVRFVVEEVYWLGGFGDRARIGWLPIEEWRNVTSKEIEEIRLPGEKKKQGTSWWRAWL